ncbi:MAG: type II secretion system F family protein [Candidatus Omnitrophica bacterium]|nr:type II secretion system F family protein [Candidatus Omnitrophota bacterium]
MNTYKYIAKDTAGRTINGVAEGNSEAEIVEILHKQELIVVAIEQSKDKSHVRLISREGKVKSEDIVIFSRQLATMIDSGISLVHALGILSEQIENTTLKNAVISLRKDLEEGMSFYSALAKHPHIFSELFINMAKAGESSGMLHEVLDRLATYLEKSAALSHKIRSSLVYPAVVVSMAIIITTVLMLKVVPTFKGVFDALGGQLPLPTRILIFISDLLRNYLFYIMAILALSGFAFGRYIKTENGRYKFDNFKLNMPVLGNLFKKLAVARFTRTFSTLVKSGVAILNALEIVSKTSGNRVIEKAITDCTSSVREGEPIALPLAKSNVFPPMVCRMIAVGEQTGQLEKMLSKIADFYEEQVDAATSALTSLIEPLVIAFLGIVIGGIVISLFMPIFQISKLIVR